MQHPIRNRAFRRAPLAGLVAALCAATPAFSADGVFELGTVVVTGAKPQLGEIGEEQVASVITQEEMKRYNRTNVADAVNLLSGVNIATNSRNEKTVYIRGYDARQAPLFIDGIPVYVPYDGYVDFNRFTTADLAAIQVAKGFSSVAYGPNALGGAINLISRKPKTKLEGDASIGFGTGNMKQAAVNVGTNQGVWYMQAGVSYADADNFRMSGNFHPVATEDGGARENSYYQDSKLSLKLGLTPNATDEYTLSYIKQEGEKGQPPTTDLSQTVRYWQWPYWDKESLYFISKTALGGHETLKVRLYQDAFRNSIRNYTNSSYSTLLTGTQFSADGISMYDDHTFGGSVELESTRLGAHTIRLVSHYKQDDHRAMEGRGNTVEHFTDTLKSYAVEDNIELAANWLLSVGYAHHEISPDLVDKSSSVYTLPGKKSADNGQIGLFYDYSPTTRLYATIAQKTRLPTLKDRYSARLGSYIENPALASEEATNYEIGYQGSPWAGAKAEAAVFYSEISDKIQSVFVSTVGSSCTSTNKCQMKNIGEVRTTGLELGLSTPLTNWLDVGGNYTYTDYKVTSDPNTKLTDIPNHKLTLHTLVRPVEKVEVVAFIESDSGRWVSNSVKLGGFTTGNLKVAYKAMKDLTTEVGVTNITDKQYQLSDGFPNPGRMWFANANYRF